MENWFISVGVAFSGAALVAAYWQLAPPVGVGLIVCVSMLAIIIGISMDKERGLREWHAQYPQPLAAVGAGSRIEFDDGTSKIVRRVVNNNNNNDEG